MNFKRILLIGSVVACPLLLASAHQILYRATLSGPAEEPSNNSPGVGSASIVIDFDLFTMQIDADFNSLQGTVTAAHIHAPTVVPQAGTAGVATQVPSFDMFPTGVTSGTYNHTFDLTQASSYNPDFIAANGGTVSGASNALFAALANRKAYFNIHTTAFPGGEVRGFIIGPSVNITQFTATRSGSQMAVSVQGKVTPTGVDVWLENSTSPDFASSTVEAMTTSDAAGQFAFNTAETAPRLFYRARGLVARATAPRP